MLLLCVRIPKSTSVHKEVVLLCVCTHISRTEYSSVALCRRAWRSRRRWTARFRRGTCVSPRPYTRSTRSTVSGTCACSNLRPSPLHVHTCHCKRTLSPSVHILARLKCTAPDARHDKMIIACTVCGTQWALHDALRFRVGLCTAVWGFDRV